MQYSEFLGPAGLHGTKVSFGHEPNKGSFASRADVVLVERRDACYGGALRKSPFRVPPVSRRRCLDTCGTQHAVVGMLRSMSPA